MSMWDDIFRFITAGQPLGIPTLVLMAIPFIVGLIIGFLVKKILKIAIIVLILALIVSYFGLFNLSFDSLKNAVNTYGPQVLNYAALIVGVLPLGIGFFLGLILGFIFG